MSARAAANCLRAGGVPGHVAAEIVRHLPAAAVEMLAQTSGSRESSVDLVRRLADMAVTGVADTLNVDQATALQVRDRLAFRSAW